MNRGDVKIRKSMGDGQESKIQSYQKLIIGQTSFLSLMKYELIVLFCSWVPGALGLLLRSKLYPLILGSVGRNVVFGSNVVFRHPHRIHIGANTIIDDNCLLDAKGVTNSGIRLGEGVFVGRNSILSCKDGDIHIEDGVNIGFNCEVFSSCTVRIGKNTLLAAYTYIVGGGNYDLSDGTQSFAEQEGLDSRGGIDIGKGAWIAAHAVVLDGVTIGDGAVLAAGAVAREDVAERTVAGGVPARVIRAIA